MRKTSEEIIFDLEKKYQDLLEKSSLADKRVEYLNQQNQKLTENNTLLAEENKSLDALIRLLRRKHYGQKTEVLSEEQLSIFNEAEVSAQETPLNLPQEELLPVGVISEGGFENKGLKNSRKPGGRRKLPDWIEREEVYIDLDESEKYCQKEGSVLKKIGEEISEKLKIIPLQIKVIRTVRYKYACSKCDESMKTAPVEPTIIPQSIATPETLAFVAVSKYEDALPLYRIENILERNKIPLSRGALANWMIRVSEACRPLINLMEEKLLESNYLNMDETTVQVLDEQGRRAQSKSYMWIRLASGKNKIVLFDYDHSRSGKTAKELLANFKGYLQVDGYGGYNFTQSQGSEIIRISCLAHIRRKFKDIFDDKKFRSQLVVDVVNLIRKIYQEEEKMGFDRLLEADKVIKYKLERVQPLLEKLFELIKVKKDAIPPKTLVGQALSYAFDELPLLIQSYTRQAEIRLDNNKIENAIRPFAVGRKNWLFAQSVAGAEASSVIYSLIETAKLNGLEPYQYLTYIFKKIPFCFTFDDYEQLLPFNLDRSLLGAG